MGCILFELMTRTPLFPGDTEGLQILEQTCVIGSPTEEDMTKLSKIVEPKIMTILKNVSTLPRLELTSLMNRNVYSDEDIVQAQDLI